MNPRLCCWQLPTLRVRERQWFASDGEITIIPYVQYECRACGRKGGMAVTEEEALALWND